MIRLPTLQGFPRIAVYAALAALVTTAMFGAEAVYRWSVDSGTKVAAPTVETRSAKAPDPAPVAAQPAVSQTAAQTSEPAMQPIVTPTVPVRTATQPAEPVPALSISPAPPVQTQASVPETAGIGAKPDERADRAPVADTTRKPVRRAIAPRQRPQQAAQQRTRTDVRRANAKRPVQARTTAQKRTPTPKPNVYFERETQLGFAPQLRTRTCNPATGNMPMQCYYPREGRERFPAKAGSQ